MSASEPSSADARWPDPAWITAAFGHRVTVRSAAGVPGPTGGPGFRDAVGFLEAVGPDGHWAIRTRTGRVVTVDPTAVVAAKIIPDSPARLRSAQEIDVATLESITAQAWQPLEQLQLGEWVLRAAGGFTGRVNSVLPLGDPGKPLDEALAVITQWYADRSLLPMIQVPLPLRADLNVALAERGWEAYNAVAVMVCDVNPLLMSCDVAQDLVARVTIDIAPTPDAAWLASFRYGGEPVPAAALPIMTKAEHPVFVSARGPAGDTLAIARGAICGRWLGVTALEVAEPYRRQGLGRSVIGALTTYAVDHACRHVFLQVAHDNVGARALYERIGFVAHHDYVYRRLAGSGG